jgi:hypothetical protein
MGYIDLKKYGPVVVGVPPRLLAMLMICGSAQYLAQSIRQAAKKINPHGTHKCLCIYPEMKSYYKRRVSEGKNKMSTLNVIQNKIISRMFAVVNRGSSYLDLMKLQLRVYHPNS